MKMLAATNNCLPCPSNGYCQGGGLECLAGFKRVGKKCAPDKEIDRTAKKLVRLFSLLIFVYLGGNETKTTRTLLILFYQE